MGLFTRNFFLGVLCSFVWLTSANAQGIDGVGRLETAGGGAYCTAALVAPDLVLTAAHCVAKWTGDVSPLSTEVLFRPGRLRGAAPVEAKFIVLHPLYRRALNGLQKLRFDLALVQLAEPVPEAVSGPLVHGAEARVGEKLFIVSWRGSDGPTPRQRACNVRRGFPGLVTLDCEVWGGESGSPVLRRGENGLEIVAVLSSKTEALDQPSAQASNVVMRLPALLQELRRQAGS